MKGFFSSRYVALKIISVILIIPMLFVFIKDITDDSYYVIIEYDYLTVTNGIIFTHTGSESIRLNAITEQDAQNEAVLEYSRAKAESNQTYPLELKTLTSYSVGKAKNEYILIFLFVMCMYGLPSIIAYKNNKKQALSILILNVLTGWTCIGWLICLIWAICKD